MVKNNDVFWDRKQRHVRGSSILWNIGTIVLYSMASHRRRQQSLLLYTICTGKENHVHGMMVYHFYTKSYFNRHSLQNAPSYGQTIQPRLMYQSDYMKTDGTDAKSTCLAPECMLHETPQRRNIWTSEGRVRHIFDAAQIIIGTVSLTLTNVDRTKLRTFLMRIWNIHQFGAINTKGETKQETGLSAKKTDSSTARQLF